MLKLSIEIDADPLNAKDVTMRLYAGSTLVAQGEGEPDEAAEALWEQALPRFRNPAQLALVGALAGRPQGSKTGGFDLMPPEAGAAPQPGALAPAARRRGRPPKPRPGGAPAEPPPVGAVDLDAALNDRETPAERGRPIGQGGPDDPRAHPGNDMGEGPNYAAGYDEPEGEGPDGPEGEAIA